MRQATSPIEFPLGVTAAANALLRCVGEFGHMLARKQIVEFADFSAAITTRPSPQSSRFCLSIRRGPTTGARRSFVVGADVREIDRLSADTIERRCQTFTGKAALCASAGATFPKRGAAVNFRNNGPEAKEHSYEQG